MTAPGQLILLRHGQTKWSVTGRHTGRSDVPLTAVGEEQAATAGNYLRRRGEQGRAIRLVFTSPLQRARRTAELAGFPGAEVESDLAEWDYGPVEGRTSAEITEQLGREWEIFSDGVNGELLGAGERPGERLDELSLRTRRVVSWLRPLVRRGDDVLIVSHGHLLRVLSTAWLGVSPTMARHLELDTASIALLGFARELPTIEGWNVAGSGAVNLAV